MCAGFERSRRAIGLRRNGRPRLIAMAIFKKPTLKTQPRKKRDIPQGLFQKCPGCNEVIHEIELNENLRVCPRCDYHFALSAKDRLKNYQERTGLTDAVISGHGMIDGYKVALAVMDFGFLAATMGSVVGERITRVIEYGTDEHAAIVIVSASGGARMYEGMLSLMQMAKTSGALARHAKQRLPYISVLTNPTTAGVMASFASLGDVIIAEPKSMIGFAGPRVIKETTQQELPERFQTAEFLQEHGLIDMIVHRKKMRDQISQLLGYFAVTP